MGRVVWLSPVVATTMAAASTAALAVAYFAWTRGGRDNGEEIGTNTDTDAGQTVDAAGPVVDEHAAAIASSDKGCQPTCDGCTAARTTASHPLSSDGSDMVTGQDTAAMVTTDTATATPPPRPTSQKPRRALSQPAHPPPATTSIIELSPEDEALLDQHVPEDDAGSESDPEDMPMYSPVGTAPLEPRQGCTYKRKHYVHAIEQLTERVKQLEQLREMCLQAQVPMPIQKAREHETLCGELKRLNATVATMPHPAR
eukprot:m.21467 g.21467  ORF g.21467 m.21467 type:complete len:256 (-) comp6431_c0_seq1:82-849(-)